MKNLIKHIRTELSLTQIEFANLLNTTQMTINRWENNKSVPNDMACNRIFELCKNKEIELTNFIISNYSGDDCLYHGSRKGLEGEIKPISRKECDFGRGFYMGDNPLHPLTLICREKNPILYKIKFDYDDLKILDLNVDINWALLISYNRQYMENVKDSDIYKMHAHLLDGVDVVRGYIADDRMYDVLNSFFELNITDEALISCLSALKLGQQVVAISEKACKNIKVIEEYKINFLEQLILKDISIKRRKEGNELSHKIEIEKRRQGLYFDEIIARGL